MNRALLVKELRENAALAAIGALAMAWALATLTGWTVHGRILDYGMNYFPFVGQEFLAWFGIVVGALAVLLGLKQAAWDEVRGTFHYLLHRPVTLGRILWLKLGVGLSIAWTVGAVMILWHALWSAQPGNHATPFYWSMTAEAWRAWITVPVAYLSAFLSGIRPGRWLGARLAPLIAGAVTTIGLATQPWWWIAVVGTVLASSVLAVCIFSTAGNRDY